MAKLTLKNLFKRYENSGKKKRTVNSFAVNDLTLECHDGEFIAMLGPSGCGKTTTLRMIAGPEDITQGDLHIGDHLVNQVQPKDRRIGLAFEDYALYPPLSVYNNIAFNLRAKGLPMVAIDQRVREIASLLKVEDLLDMMPVKLSGGQKQRVNIARAIVRKPELLLMDEPTTFYYEDRTYEPSNFGDKFYGNVPMRMAMPRSWQRRTSGVNFSRMRSSSSSYWASLYSRMANFFLSA